MAGKIVVSEILSDATSSNTVKIGTGMTLDLNAQGTIVLPMVPDSKLPTIPSSKLPTIPSSKMPTGSVVNTWSIGMTGPTVTVSTVNWTTIGCSADISVTAGNKLFVQMASGIHCYESAPAKHFAIDVYFNGVTMSSPSWGVGISHGDTAYTGWFNTGSIAQTTIASTGTYTIELKAKSNSGSIRFGLDGLQGGGWGYDCPKMLVWEIKG